MLDLRIIADGNALPLFDLPAALGRDRAMREVGDQIEALIAFMDDLAGDPDLEDSEAGETEIDAAGRSLTCHTLADEVSNDSADNGDRAWQEWDSRGPAGHRWSHEPVGTVRGTEDDEDDDPAGDYLDMIGEASSDDGRGLLPTLPVWALNQTEGPVNHKQAQREYLAAETELVRLATGGWCQAT